MVSVVVRRTLSLISQDWHSCAVGALYSTPLLITHEVNVSAVACAGLGIQSPALVGSFVPLATYTCAQDQVLEHGGRRVVACRRGCGWGGRGQCPLCVQCADTPLREGKACDRVFGPILLGRTSRRNGTIPPVALHCSYTVHQASCTLPPNRGTDRRSDRRCTHVFALVIAPSAQHSSQGTSSAEKGLVKPFCHRMPFTISALFPHCSSAFLHRSCAVRNGAIWPAGQDNTGCTV